MKYFNEPSSTSGLNAIEVESESNNITIVDYENPGKNLFIKVKTERGNTLLDFTGAGDYILYCYNKNKHLDSRHCAINNLSSFIIQSPYKTILLMRYDIPLKKEEGQYCPNHLIAELPMENISLEERVDILAENPERYQLSSNLCLLRGDRQAILREYLDQAVYLEKFELCKKIVEVKTFLGIVNDQYVDKDSVFLLETLGAFHGVLTRYFLKKDGGLLRLYYRVEGSQEMIPSHDFLVVNESLNKTHVMKLLRDRFKGLRPFEGIPRFSNSGLLDEADFNLVIIPKNTL